MNLWWSWSREARGAVPLDRRARSGISPATTRSSCSAGSIPPAIAACASDSDFLRRYDDVMARLAHGTTSPDTWFAQRYPGLDGRPVAYFCAEFGLHNSVPIYSGGLGVLAGDHCKARERPRRADGRRGPLLHEGLLRPAAPARRMAGGQRRGVRHQPHAARAGHRREAGAVPHHGRDLRTPGARARLADDGGPGADLSARHQPRA